MASIRAADGHRRRATVLAGRDARKATPITTARRRRRRRVVFLRRGEFR